MTRIRLADEVFDAVFSSVVQVREVALQEIQESFFGLGEAVPFVEGQDDADKRSDAVDGGFDWLRPTGDKDEFDYANGDTQQVNEPASANEGETLAVVELRLEPDLEAKLDKNAENGNRNASKERGITNHGVGLCEQEEAECTEQ